MIRKPTRRKPRKMYRYKVTKVYPGASAGILHVGYIHIDQWVGKKHTYKASKNGEILPICDVELLGRWEP